MIVEVAKTHEIARKRELEDLASAVRALLEQADGAPLDAIDEVAGIALAEQELSGDERALGGTRQARRIGGAVAR
jgi:hypothetical protein